MSEADDSKPYFVWDGSLDTGIEAIDVQHRQIADYLNRLHTALRARNTPEIKAVLDEVVTYTQQHFGFEETLLLQAGYDKVKGHQQVHRAFAERMRAYQASYTPENDTGRRLLSDLRIWLTDHIRREDGDFAAVLRAYQKTQSQGWLGKTFGRLFGGR